MYIYILYITHFYIKSKEENNIHSNHYWNEYRHLLLYIDLLMSQTK